MTYMKEKQLWSFLLREWDVSIWTIVHRIIWLAVVGWAVLGLVSLAGGCDDASSRKLQDNTVLPSERAHDINYGKP